jgi:membrane protease YdiL (CAAX protease family)
MWQSFSNNFLKKPKGFKPWMALALPLWVGGGFIVAEVIVELLLSLLNVLKVPLGNLSDSTIQTISAAAVYAVAIIIVVGLPWWVMRFRTTRREIGLDHHLTWLDLLLAPSGFVIYILLSFLLTSLASHLPWYNSTQAQDTGFSQLNHGYEYFLAFFTLVIVAPVAEETLFRGYLLGKLRKYLPLWAAILTTSLLFGIIHFAWNVGVDVFALSIVLCLLRVWSGRLWPSIVLHMIKNGIAFYFLFIIPLL